MRKAVIAVLTLLALAWVGYLVWPIYTLVSFARALERGDVTTAMAHVDFRAVHESLTEQVLETHLRLSGKRISPLARGAVRSATALAEPVLGRVVTPEGLADFVRTGWPRQVLKERPADAVGLTRATLGGAWYIFWHADYGIRRFDIVIPGSVTRSRQFRFRFRLRQWRWQLSAIRLPESIQELLAEALGNALKSQR